MFMFLKFKLSSLTFIAGLAAALFGTGTISSAQETGGGYQLVKDWASIPDGGAWGAMAAVSTDAHGNVYAFQRGGTAKVMVFDAHGKFLRQWGTEEFEFPHGLTVGPGGSVWISDKKREQVMKFSPEGKLMMTIGQKDVTGDATSENGFNGLANVAIGKNGDIFVADGENSAPGVPPYNNRVVKYSKEGKFLKMWGTKGAAQGEFTVPHSIAIDSKGHVWVGDRGNKRMQVFNADGKFLVEYTQFGAPASIYISKDDTVYVGGKDNIVIGKLDGTVIATIDDVPDPHGIAVDETTGAIYVAQVGPKAILKFVKK
jgi:DNA-binding beta-propeller fold protein YncE